MGKHADSVLNGWAIDLGIAKRRGFKRGKHAPTYAGKRETLLEAILASVKRTTVGKYPNGLHAWEKGFSMFILGTGIVFLAMVTIKPKRKKFHKTY